MALSPATALPVSGEDVREVWNPGNQFRTLISLGKSLGGSGQLSAHEAGPLVLDVCATSGQVSFVTDYVHEVCGDSSVSSSEVADMALLDGDMVHEWITSRTGSAHAELVRVCGTGSGMSDDTLLAQLHTRLLAYAAVNSALSTAGLHSKAVPPGPFP